MGKQCKFQNFAIFFCYLLLLFIRSKDNFLAFPSDSDSERVKRLTEGSKYVFIGDNLF